VRESADSGEWGEGGGRTFERVDVAKDARDQLSPRAPVRFGVDTAQAFDVCEQNLDPLVGLGQKFAQQLVVHRTRL
jgi:hypothetical protein